LNGSKIESHISCKDHRLAGELCDQTFFIEDFLTDQGLTTFNLEKLKAPEIKSVRLEKSTQFVSRVFSLQTEASKSLQGG
jgi:hypothetical protein